jgi:GH15 family glucan-1,4-alpha-glucosidase
MTFSVNDPMREHSLRVILDNQTADGAYIACPNMPDYQFSWFRDGAYIAYALTLDGDLISAMHGDSIGAQWESVFKFHSWCAERINERAERISRAMASAERGERPDARDVLNARYRADGQEGPDEWPEFQLDGIGTWLWSLGEYIRYTGFTPLPVAWEAAAETAARYLAALWRTPCYDCWEERGSDIHVSTLAAIYAGLAAAETLIPALAGQFEGTRAAIKAFVLERGLTPGGELAKSVGLDMMDANLMMVSVPHGLFAPDDPVMVRTVARIERDLHAKTGGVHRHVEDVYYGGGAWVLLALHLGWYYAEAGDFERARAELDWALTQADADGNLPEQVISSMLAPAHYDPWVAQRGAIALPLLWSHAEYLILRHKLAQAK